MGWFTKLATKVSDSVDSFLFDNPHPRPAAAGAAPPREQQQQQQQQAEPQEQPAPPDPKVTIDDLRSGRPIVEERPGFDGGSQSLRAIETGMRRDEDGDEAHDFLLIDQPPASARFAGDRSDGAPSLAPSDDT